LIAPERGARAPLAVVVAFLALALSSSVAHAELKLQPADPAAPPTYVPPGVAVAPAPAPRPEPVTRKWWFWTAVGAAVVTTVVIVVVATREPSPPGSTLGNMNAFMGK
jgi:hypothetical protein